MAIQQPGMFGLAGVTPNQEDLVAKIRAEQQARNQSLTQNLGKYAGLAQQGMENVQQGAFGTQDPRLQRNSQVIAARDAVRAKGITDPEEQLQEMARELSNRGLYDEADRVMQRLQEAQRAKRTETREEEKLGLDKRRVDLETDRIALQREQEARAARLTDAQIAEIRQRMSEGKFDVQVIEDKNTGKTVVIEIDKRTGKRRNITDEILGTTPENVKPEDTDAALRQKAKEAYEKRMAGQKK